jgi:quinolinate synthase
MSPDTLTPSEVAEKLNNLGYLDVTVDRKTDLVGEINRLRREKNAVILAHYYQTPDIQDIADYVGDSLGLSQQAASTTADLIAFAGVHFMGETAKILNPAKKVVLPDLKAGCSLAESAPAPEFKAFRDQHPDHVVITYINCTAEIKAMSDIICTSANAEKIVNSVPRDTPIIFAPDKNLGRYLIRKTGREMLLWDGACRRVGANPALATRVRTASHYRVHRPQRR